MAVKTKVDSIRKLKNRTSKYNRQLKQKSKRLAGKSNQFNEITNMLTEENEEL